MCILLRDSTRVIWHISRVSSAIDYPKHVHALATKSRANLKISRVSARDMRASVKFELIYTVCLLCKYITNTYRRVVQSMKQGSLVSIYMLCAHSV